MSTDVPVRCFCGSFEAIAHDVSPRDGTHTTCYCDDCQAFQRFLGQERRVLDDHGGTEIFQMSSGKYEVIKGEEHLACVKLGPKGIVRWYASCCNTPLGNTLGSAAMPFVGIVAASFDITQSEVDIDGALGPRSRGVHASFARGERSELDADDGVPFTMVVGFVGKVVRWKLRGDTKRAPFFDAKSGKLTVKPIQLSKAQRDALSRR